jgi:hypothetical protein
MRDQFKGRVTRVNHDEKSRTAVQELQTAGGMGTTVLYGAGSGDWVGGFAALWGLVQL